MPDDPPSERSLSEGDLAADPIAMFSAWYAEAAAAGETEPDAMALATADVAGRPSVRFVLLKGWGAAGFVFYTNEESRKGAELRANPAAAVAFRWARLDRQVRVEGPALPVDPGESDAYFAGRPRRSQVGSWASAQSRPLRDRAQLDELVAEAEGRLAGSDVPRPPYWYGWRLRPEVIEFWQGRTNRLHDRLVFRRAGGGWDRTRLAP